MRIAIIGGSGVVPSGDFAEWRDFTQKTFFGEAAGVFAKIDNHEIVFVHRHGRGHTIAPHNVNHEANISAIRELDISAAIGIFTVGSLVDEYKPSDLIPLSDFINYSFSGTRTFYKNSSYGVVHTDFTTPYCTLIYSALIDAINAPNFKECVYVGVDGPRYETPSEIRMFKSFGGHVIGMTAVPESVLAREAGICYAGLALVTNFAAGLTQDPLSHEEVLRIGQTSSGKIWETILKAVSNIDDTNACSCRKNWDLWSANFTR